MGRSAIRRIAVDARPLENSVNGIGRYCREILRQIIANTDWEIVLLTNHPLVEAHVGSSRAEVVATGSFLGSTFVGFNMRAAKLIAAMEIDLYFSPRHHLPRGLNCPQVVTIHDLAWIDVPSTMKFPGPWIERGLMPHSIAIADAVIAVSNFTGAAVASNFPQAADKIRVIYQSSFLEADNSRSQDENSDFLLAVGTHEPRKNYLRLLHAFVEVSAKHPGVRLVIVGRPGWKMDLPALVNQSGLGERVTLLTDADDVKLAQLYRDCLAVVQPSLYEGFGLPLVEAIHFAKPILTSNCSAMPEIAGNAGYLVNPVDSQSIARGMLCLIEDQNLRQRLSRAARLRAQAFSWQTAGRCTIELFEEVVAERRTA